MQPFVHLSIVFWLYTTFQYITIDVEFPCFPYILRYFIKTGSFPVLNFVNTTLSSGKIKMIFGEINNVKFYKFVQKHWGHTLICRLVWLHTQREDEANNFSQWSPQRNHRSNNDALQKQVSKSSLTGRRHILLWHCRWCSERGYTSPILFIIWLDYTLRTSIDLMKENGFALEKAISRQYQHKLSATRITMMT